MRSSYSLFSLIFSVFVFFPSTSNAQTFKETMIEFKKFEAITKAGVNYRRYVESLATIEYATEAYASEADELNTVNKDKFKAALRQYKLAGDGWMLYHATIKHGVPEMFSETAGRICPRINFWTAGGSDNFHECISEAWNIASRILIDAKEVKSEKAEPGAAKKKK